MARDSLHIQEWDQELTDMNVHGECVRACVCVCVCVFVGVARVSECE